MLFDKLRFSLGVTHPCHARIDATGSASAAHTPLQCVDCRLDSPENTARHYPRKAKMEVIDLIRKAIFGVAAVEGHPSLRL